MSELRPDRFGFLYSEDGSGDDACPLASLLQLLRLVSNRDMPAAEVVASAEGLRPLPGVREIEALRIWPQGLETLLATDRLFGFLGRHRSTAVAKAAFSPIEPVLHAWHSDLAFSNEEAVGRAWLDRIGWPEILAAAKRRDEAAWLVLAGRAELIDGDVMAIASAR